MKVLLTPTPDFRRQYYGERALNGLRDIADVRLHEGAEALDAAGLVAAASDADIIVADRVTEGRGEIFPQLPKLRAMVRCAVDIRNIDVAAATRPAASSASAPSCNFTSAMARRPCSARSP